MAALGLAAFITASSAQAQDIVFQMPQTITGDANLITPNGTTITEFDAIVPSVTTPQTVDGITFNASSGAGGLTVGDSNISLTLNSGSWTQYNDNTPGTGNGNFTPLPTGPSVSAGFSSVVQEGVFSSGNAGTITLSGLTLGNTYDVQIFDRSNDGGATGGNAESTNLLSSNSVNIFDYQTDGTGQFVTGTFTATGTSEIIDISSASGPFTPVIGAINVEQLNAAAVPEPSTYALLLSGALVALVFFNIRTRRTVS